MDRSSYQRRPLKSTESERRTGFKEKQIIKKLFSQVEKQGFKARIVSAKHVPSLQQEINAWRRMKAICRELDREYLKEFDFSTKVSPFKPESIIVVASPQPIVRVSFSVNGKLIPVIIPPTYLHSTDERVRDLLVKVLEPEGFHVAQEILPAKSLAVHSGLAEYGKNNIAYVRGMGSFFRLTAFSSDLPSQDETWIEHQTMERCLNCSACLKSCPTEAISSERFLLHAERCLTFHNEGQRDFPTWLDPSWHHCLVGCLRCQVMCPENKDYRNWIENKTHFSEAETALILNKLPGDKLPAKTMKKLEGLFMMEYIEILSRNMRALLNNEINT